MFRTEVLARTFDSAYDAELARWPHPTTSLDVPGRYGTTHVQVCGPPDGPPLVLLPGGGCTSTVWFAVATALARTHRVHAPDPIGGPGRSVTDRPPRRVADLMTWLDTLLDGLHLDTTALGGHSYGGWQALGYALHAPTRITRLALLDPTDCFAGLSLAYRLRALPLLARPTAARMRAVVEWESNGSPLDESSLALTCLGAEYRGRTVLPRRPPVGRLTVPTLLLLAERSRAHDVHRVRATAQRLVPGIGVTVLTGASHHSVPTTNSAQLTRELLAFLAPEP
jgi:pimeloyl-ACP methyl ester carboxylesterase